MNINIEENNHGTVTLIVEEVTGIEVPLKIEGEFDPGQELKRASMKDQIGQEGLSATFEITDVRVVITETCILPVSIYQVSDELDNDGFYSAVIEQIQGG